LTLDIAVCGELAMADLAFVLVTVAVFAVLFLVAKAVEKL
jgi:hypothetical protein